MKLSSNTPLANELSDPEIRQHTVGSQIKIGVPFQLRAMREHRRWTQETLAEKLDTTQNTISRLENPKTAKPTITTLLRLAQAFDVGLLVRFVPFGFYGDVIDAMNATHIEIPSYEEELTEEIAALKESGQPQALDGAGQEPRAEIVNELPAKESAGILEIAPKQGRGFDEFDRQKWGAALQTQRPKQFAKSPYSPSAFGSVAGVDSTAFTHAEGQ